MRARCGRRSRRSARRRRGTSRSSWAPHGRALYKGVLPGPPQAARHAPAGDLYCCLVPTHRSLHRCARTRGGRELQQLPHRARRRGRAAHPDPHHAAAPAPRWPTTDRRPSVVAPPGEGWLGTCDRFRVHLRGTGTFRPVSPVVFVGVVEGISQCEQLAAGVRQGPAGDRARLPLPPARHGRPPPAARTGWSRRSRTSRTSTRRSTSHEMWMYLHDDALGLAAHQGVPPRRADRT